jgi:hypothetical protein
MPPEMSSVQKKEEYWILYLMLKVISALSSILLKIFKFCSELIATTEDI